jgi:hypothetical protein
MKEIILVSISKFRGTQILVCLSVIITKIIPIPNKQNIVEKHSREVVPRYLFERKENKQWFIMHPGSIANREFS